MDKILVVDDEEEQLDNLQWAAKGPSREIYSAGSRAQALALIEEHDFAVVVTDLRMESPEAGLDVLTAAKSKDVFTQVILVTAYGTPEVSVKTMRLGAYDYLERGSPGVNHLQMLKAKIDRALEFRAAKLQAKESRHEYYRPF